MGDSARPDEGVQGRPLHADVPAELDVVDAALGDEAADESLAGAQVVAGLAGGQQLVGTGVGDADGSVGHGLGIHGGTMTRPPPVFLLYAASSPVSSQESRCPSPSTTGRRNWSCTGEPRSRTVVSSEHALFVPRTARAGSPCFVEGGAISDAPRRSAPRSFMGRSIPWRTGRAD